MALLEVNNVSKSFGGVKANVDISLEVEQGSIVGIIGPNGSGKTTLFNSIVGTHPIDSGSIKFNGKLYVEYHYDNRIISWFIIYFEIQKSFH